ncbi:PITH domain-containing protein [Pisolithus croceorrhizus]|nr:PITH domain-containing protein [Pisolithus croceorrhizus]
MAQNEFQNGPKTASSIVPTSNKSSNLRSIVASKKTNPPDSSFYLASNADEQLLFNQIVRIRTLVISNEVVAERPKTIKLRANNPSISFSDVEGAADKTFAQVIELSADDVTEGKSIPLRFFHSRTSVNGLLPLPIFVESNRGESKQTRIDAIDVLGVPVDNKRPESLAATWCIFKIKRAHQSPVIR